MDIFANRSRMLELLVYTLIFTNLGIEAAYKYVNTDATLSTMPHTIDLSVKKILLNNTKIATVDFIEDFPNCINFTLDKCHVKELPDMFNITGTLLSLTIRRCLLQDIPIQKLSSLTKLTHLNFDHNQLNYFPDATGQMNLTLLSLTSNHIMSFPYLPNIGRTLEGIKLADNQITHVSRLKLSVFVNITRILLGRNLLKSIPDFQAIPSPNFRMLYLNKNQIKAQYFKWENLANFNMSVSLKNNSFEISELPNPWLLHSSRMSQLDIDIRELNTLTCDYKAKALYLAQKLALLRFDDLSCDHPPQFAGRKLESLTFQDLSRTQGFITKAKAALVPPGAEIGLRGTISYDVVTQTAEECAVHCFAHHACCMYEFQPNTNMCTFYDCSQGVTKGDFFAPTGSELYFV